MKKKILSGILAFSMMFGIAAPMPETVSAANAEPKEIVLEKSTHGNPIAGFNEKGEVTYAGDPAILVDGDTVYLYVGHDDTSSGGGYTMPNYLCYSTQDLKEWKYEGVTMEMTDVTWADNVSAWASQVIKYQDMYYLLYCAEKAGGKGKATGAAVSNSPTGPFRDVGILINPEDTDASKYTSVSGKTRRGSFGWEDIDPTAWIDTDEEGNDHVYMAWGNTNCWMCELEINGDSVKVKDQNGDGSIKQEDDIWWQDAGAIELIASDTTNKNDMVDFTEAPYLYRRQDENGNYYGPYYLFFAMHWREEMGYATIDKLGHPDDPEQPYNVWTYGGQVMEPTGTSNTNHPAVFDFQGHTYFIYHNGSLPGGSGYRRVICIEELKFDEDGKVQYVQETSTGLTGVTSLIYDSSNKPLAHDAFNNSINSAEYPYKDVAVTPNSSAAKADMLWEIEEGKADKSKASYVTIESYNKPGMYLTVDSSRNVVLAHDHNDDKACTSKGITKDSMNMTFRTLAGFAGGGVTFESVAFPGYYLVSKDGKLSVSKNPDAQACTFGVTPDAKETKVTAQKSTRTYMAGDKISDSDIRIKIEYDNGTSYTRAWDYTTNAASINTDTPGTKELVVTHKLNGQTLESKININILSKQAPIQMDVDPEGDLPKVNSIYTVKKLKYKITKTDEYNTDGSNGTVTLMGYAGNKMTKLTVPDTVTIEGYTFKVKAIGAKAFNKKSKLKTITIGDNVTSIGKNAITGINKKATIKVSSDRYKKVKKMLNKKAGFKKPMKIKQI